jgi:hypothetical protein
VGAFDGGEDLQGATALRTLLDVDIEHSFEQPGPGSWEAGAMGGRTSPWSAEGVLALTGTFGMMSGRSLALGASTP